MNIVREISEDNFLSLISAFYEVHLRPSLAQQRETFLGNNHLESTRKFDN